MMIIMTTMMPLLKSDDADDDADDDDDNEQDTGGELEGRPLLVPLRPSCPVNRRHRVITPSRLQLYQRT